MQDRTPFVSAESLRALGRFERIMAVIDGDAPKHPLQPPLKGEPYAVEKYPGVNGTVNLVGRDGRGEIMLETRMAASKYSAGMVARMVRWLKAHDDGPPPLTLVP